MLEDPGVQANVLDALGAAADAQQPGEGMAVQDGEEIAGAPALAAGVTDEDGDGVAGS